MQKHTDTFKIAAMAVQLEKTLYEVVDQLLV